MSRRDTHLDALLRERGAAYYQTLHGRGTAAEVARGVESVAAAGERQVQAGPRRAVRLGCRRSDGLPDGDRPGA
jgi:hypothetical protein